jgi:hypothetical protein
VNSFTGETVSSLRIKGKSHKPRVLLPGTYDILVGEGEPARRLDRISASGTNSETIQVEIQ